MLRVFVHVNGGQDPIEILMRPAGQQFAQVQTGRKAHFWWPVEELAKTDENGHQTLATLVPHLDRVIVGRQTASGWQHVFEGAVVECGYDISVVSLTAFEPPRPAAPPPAPPQGGVREPLAPLPGTGPGPEAGYAEVPNAPRDFLFGARQVQQPVPLGSRQSQ